MGMYTELHLNAKLKEGVPQYITDILTFMVAKTTIESWPLDGDWSEVLIAKSKNIDNLPSHELFQCQNWEYMLNQDSYYFASDTISTLRKDFQGDWFLCIRCNLKNYAQEIQKFIDWLQPYVDTQYGREFLGFFRYEDDENPTLIYVDDKSSIFVPVV